jgi:hypothetical protein
MVRQQRALDHDVLDRGPAVVVVVVRRAGTRRPVRVVAVVLGELFPVDLVDVRRLLDLGRGLFLVLLGGLEAVDGRGFVLARRAPCPRGSPRGQGFSIIS